MEEIHSFTSLYIVTILKKYSSEERPLTAKKVAEIIPKEFHLHKGPTEKTVRTHLTNLAEYARTEMIDGEVIKEEVN